MDFLQKQKANPQIPMEVQRTPQSQNNFEKEGPRQNKNLPQSNKE